MITPSFVSRALHALLVTIVLGSASLGCGSSDGSTSNDLTDSASTDGHDFADAGGAGGSGSAVASSASSSVTSSSSSGSGAGGTGSSNDCCVDNATLGCADPKTEACVCGLDPFCCSTAWDGMCVTMAQNDCNACGGPQMDPPDAGSGGSGNGGGASCPECIATECGLDCILLGTCAGSVHQEIYQCLAVTCALECWGWKPPCQGGGDGSSGGDPSGCDCDISSDCDGCWCEPAEECDPSGSSGSGAGCDCDTTWGCDGCWCEPARECAPEDPGSGGAGGGGSDPGCSCDTTWGCDGCWCEPAEECDPSSSSSGGDPGLGNCCDGDIYWHVGCDDPDVEACVCYYDSSCCTSQWTDACVSTVAWCGGASCP